jgi:hypothetical protein
LGFEFPAVNAVICNRPKVAFLSSGGAAIEHEETSVQSSRVSFFVPVHFRIRKHRSTLALTGRKALWL